MSKKNNIPSSNSQIDNSFDASQFEVVHSGSFSPMWKPTEKDEYLIVIPRAMRKIEMTQGKGKKAIVKENYLMECVYQGGNTLNLYTSKTQTEVSKGDTVSVPISYGLIGELALAQHQDTNDDESELVPSSLALYCASNSIPVMVKFLEKVPTKGGQQVKRFVVLAPKGVKENIK